MVMPKELITLDKKMFHTIITDALGYKNPKCDFCKKKITARNFGYVSRDVMCCNSIVCLIKTVHKEEEDKEED